MENEQGNKKAEGNGGDHRRLISFSVIFDEKYLAKSPSRINLIFAR